MPREKQGILEFVFVVVVVVANEKENFRVDSIGERGDCIRGDARTVTYLLYVGEVESLCCVVLLVNEDNAMRMSVLQWVYIECDGRTTLELLLHQ